MAIEEQRSTGYNLGCMVCGRTYPGDELRYRCDCGEPIDIMYSGPAVVSRELLDSRLGAGRLPFSSGVWRYREMLPAFEDADIVSRPEGNTNLYGVGGAERGGLRRVGEYAGLEWLALKHEGENPTGSFKDRGMTVGVSQAVRTGARAVACASTGNTSASLASYAAQAGLPCFVFVPEGNISLGKLAQTLAYGAITLQVRGDFDSAMSLVQAACAELGIYLVNSVNPFRIEGQKTIGLEILQQLAWEPPDWIVLPAGNLGNTAALGKALQQALDLGLITRLPRIASVQAAGANPFFQSYTTGFSERFTVTAHTVATAIKIGAPVSFARARRAIEVTNGLVVQVADEDILDAKAVIDRAGIGCEPASAASVAGARRLVLDGDMGAGERVVCILTGHLLKDSDTTLDYHLGRSGAAGSYANRPVLVDATIDAVRRTLESHL
ncbi:MAG: threonine synthase [Chloroflexota bacterium]|nr:threonine synthase [Chloroflexota bacterium]MDQ5865228.1 threonine synthase [Chloroflexota bacterium]